MTWVWVPLTASRSSDRLAVIDLVAHAGLLRRLHEGPEVLLLANAWDAASAAMVEEVGFPVVATSSAAVAASLGFPDRDRMDVDAAFAAVARVAAAVSVPVTADLEAGYRLAPRELVDRLLAAGAVGCNLEDTDHHGSGATGGPGLVEAEAQAERLAAVKEAGRSAGVDVVVNARVDVHLRQDGPPAGRLDEMVRRGRLYREAGADCVYPIGVADEDQIRALVDGIGGPINVMLRRGAPDVHRLRALGVRRASMASGLFRAALAAARQVAERLDAGTG